MARRRRAGRTARVPIPDEELIERLARDAPGSLDATIPEDVFGRAVKGLLEESPFSGEAPHFYCRKCGEYHLKTHKHYESQA